MKTRHALLSAALLIGAPCALAGAQQIGTTYRNSTPNSTGHAGVLNAYGVPLQSGGNVALVAANCPPGSMGLFFYGQSRASLPFADGTLCIDPSRGGFSRIQPVAVIDPTGGAVHYLTNEESTPGPGGDPDLLTLNYQFWFRDMAAAGTGSNTTSAIEIEFEPCDNCR